MLAIRKGLTEGQEEDKRKEKNKTNGHSSSSESGASPSPSPAPQISSEAVTSGESDCNSTNGNGVTNGGH